MWSQGRRLLHSRRGDAEITPRSGDLHLLSEYGYDGFDSSLDLTTSMTRCRPTSPCCKTEDDTPKRLDDHRCGDRVSAVAHVGTAFFFFAILNTKLPHSCPDPHCRSRMKITRAQRRIFSHSAVTAVPLPQNNPPEEEQNV